MVTVALIADRPELAGALARMQWEEWGRDAGEALEEWIAVARGDTGRLDIPVGFVALQDGAVAGGVSLRAHDIPQRRDRSPWVCGTIVRADLRRRGVGLRLMRELDAWAARGGIAEGWVWTGQAAGFYERCGWVAVERLANEGRMGTVLRRSFGAPLTP